MPQRKKNADDTPTISAFPSGQTSPVNKKKKGGSDWKGRILAYEFILHLIFVKRYGSLRIFVDATFTKLLKFRKRLAGKK